MRIHASSFMTYSTKAFVYLSLLASILFFGCENKSGEGGLTEEVATSQSDVHVAFAGGGWRAHTGHSAWVISLLDNNSSKNATTLSEAFTNINTISSNSGGSWFSTMLMYSDDFVSDIQAPKAIETWDSTGWIGLQKNHFNAATYQDLLGFTHQCSHHLGNDPGKIEQAEYIDCIADYFAGSPYYWKKLIDSLIFKDYNLGSMTLSNAKQPWASDKSLLIASTLLNNSVVLNKSGLDDHVYYQTCLQNTTLPSNMPVLNGDNTASCSAGLPKDVAAVTFSSLAQGSTLTSLPFFRELDSTGSLYNIGYTLDYEFGTPPKADTTIQLPLGYSNVPVMTAAAASSAAAGFAASERISGSFDVSYIAEDLSLSFKLGNSTVDFVQTDTMSFNSLVDHKVVRLADGGTVDNSGVAQIVSFLQNNNQGNGFNIVAFDNVGTIYSPGGKGANIGIDLASLFGAPDPIADTIVIDVLGIKKEIIFDIEMPTLQIFDSTAMINTPATWSFPAQNGQQVFYTRYDVTTIDNEALGIASNSTGSLHAFTFVSNSAGIMPNQGDASFEAYSDMINYINSSLNAKNAKGQPEGLNHLKHAFGI